MIQNNCSHTESLTTIICLNRNASAINVPNYNRTNKIKTSLLKFYSVEQGTAFTILHFFPSNSTLMLQNINKNKGFIGKITV